MAETARQIVEFAQPETEFTDYELHAEERLERLNHKLGELGLQRQKSFLSNDPLAHVLLRLEAGRFDRVDAQVESEYRTDMAERSEVTEGLGAETGAKPFALSFNYIWKDGELVYDRTGKAMNDMLGSGIAVERANVGRNTDYQYHLDRAKVLASHGPAITEWWQSKPETSAVIASLCPSASEVSPEIAELGNFKPHRNMASIWFLEATDDGVIIRIASEDNLTLDGLQHVYDQLGADVKVHETTVEELAEIRPLPLKGSLLAQRSFTETHDKRLDEEFASPGEEHFQGIKTNGYIKDALSFVEVAEETESFYKNAVEAVALSLEGGKIDSSLANLLLELRQGYASSADIPKVLHLSSPLNIDQARLFMEHLLKQALPESIYGDKQTHQTEIAVAGTADSETRQVSGVAAAGAYASTNDISRDGSCPTSSLDNEGNAADAVAAAAMGVSANKEFESHFCPNCLPKPKAGKTVKAYRKGSRIGCHDCGYEQDICTKKVTKKPREAEADGSQDIDLFAPVISYFERHSLEKRIDELATKQAKAELGENVRYLDLMRYRKQLRQVHGLNT